MALPSCQCVAGQPPFARLGDIFCALSQIDLACVIPTLLSATIDASGDFLTLVFDEAVTSSGSGFSIRIDGDLSAVFLDSGSGTMTLVFTIDAEVPEGATVTLDYEQADGDTASGECLLESIADFPVTNNTGLQFFYLRPDGVSRYLRPDGVSFYIRP